jgi:hypothetical protein
LAGCFGLLYAYQAGDANMESLFDLHAVPECIAAAARLREQRECSPIEALRDRNPVEFLQRRAEALAQRAADLKKLADAWQPLWSRAETADGCPCDLYTS